jgi:hypothetical protein
MWVLIRENIPVRQQAKEKYENNAELRKESQKYLVDAVTQRIGDATNDSPADFRCCHFPEIGRGHVRVERGVWSANQIGNFFQRTLNKSRRKPQNKTQFIKCCQLRHSFD